jgi:hypothetical protein
VGWPVTSAATARTARAVAARNARMTLAELAESLLQVFGVHYRNDLDLSVYRLWLQP